MGSLGDFFDFERYVGSCGRYELGGMVKYLDGFWYWDFVIIFMEERGLWKEGNVCL